MSKMKAWNYSSFKSTFLSAPESQQNKISTKGCPAHRVCGHSSDMMCTPSIAAWAQHAGLLLVSVLAEAWCGHRLYCLGTATTDNIVSHEASIAYTSTFVLLLLLSLVIPFPQVEQSCY